ncbi:MAG: histidine kinase N-terminal domain-containing protein [Chloroflexi bacterium]|nr:histidine kinase N-terminal domain-containing protein [Chloroflexota bacterium]
MTETVALPNAEAPAAGAARNGAASDDAADAPPAPLNLSLADPPLEAAVRGRLRRIAEGLDLLADLTSADVALFVRANDHAVVVAQGRPRPVPPLYPESLVGRQFTRADAPAVFRALFDGRGGRLVNVVMVRGVPTMHEVFPVHDEWGRVVAAVSSDMAMLEHERLRKRSAIFRRAVSRVRELVVSGALEGTEALGRMGVHDGVLLIDAHGQIQYISAVAEHLYRRLGSADSLVHTQLAELDTNEYVCFRAMELGRCLEQRVEEQGFIWIKRAVPLLPTEERTLLGRLKGSVRRANGAVVLIQDITDEVRKEQELKIKSAMIQEIHHRVKNNLQTIAALLRLQARRAELPEVAEQLTQTVSRILSIAVVHEFLSKDEASIINIHEVTNRMLQEVTHGTLDPEKKISLKLEGSKNFRLPAQQATSCALVINELLQNAVEHGYRDRSSGTIAVRLIDSEEGMRVEIVDDGGGLPAEFDLEKSGLGLRIVRTLVREDLKGQFELRAHGDGVMAVVSFPRWRLEPGRTA